MLPHGNALHRSAISINDFEYSDIKECAQKIDQYNRISTMVSIIVFAASPHF